MLDPALDVLSRFGIEFWDEDRPNVESLRNVDILWAGVGKGVRAGCAFGADVDPARDGCDWDDPMVA